MNKLLSTLLIIFATTSMGSDDIRKKGVFVGKGSRVTNGAVSTYTNLFIIHKNLFIDVYHSKGKTDKHVTQWKFDESDKGQFEVFTYDLKSQSTGDRIGSGSCHLSFCSYALKFEKDGVFMEIHEVLALNGNRLSRVGKISGGDFTSYWQAELFKRKPSTNSKGCLSGSCDPEAGGACECDSCGCDTCGCDKNGDAAPNAGSDCSCKEKCSGGCQID